jgi:hypothetical protein
MWGQVWEKVRPVEGVREAGLGHRPASPTVVPYMVSSHIARRDVVMQGQVCFRIFGLFDEVHKHFWP